MEAARSTFLGGGGRHPVLVDLSGEVRLARWDEIDLDAEVWTVLAERMKANHEHRVPLSCRATEILRTALTVRNGAKLLFPSPRGKPLSDMTLSKLLKEHGVQAVPHGFRCCSRPWRHGPRSFGPRGSAAVPERLAYRLREPHDRQRR